MKKIIVAASQFGAAICVTMATGNYWLGVATFLAIEAVGPELK
jgi:hypothetical protein